MSVENFNCKNVKNQEENVSYQRCERQEFRLYSDYLDVD